MRCQIKLQLKLLNQKINNPVPKQTKQGLSVVPPIPLLNQNFLVHLFSSTCLTIVEALIDFPNQPMSYIFPIKKCLKYTQYL